MGTNWTADDVNRILGRGTSAPSSPSGKKSGWTADDVNRLLNPEPKRTKAESDSVKTTEIPVLEAPKTTPSNPRATQQSTVIPMTSTGGRNVASQMVAEAREHKAQEDKSAQLAEIERLSAMTDAELEDYYAQAKKQSEGNGFWNRVFSNQGQSDFDSYSLASNERNKRLDAKNNAVLEQNTSVADSVKALYDYFHSDSASHSVDTGKADDISTYFSDEMVSGMKNQMANSLLRPEQAQSYSDYIAMAEAYQALKNMGYDPASLIQTYDRNQNAVEDEQTKAYANEHGVKASLETIPQNIAAGLGGSTATLNSWLMGTPLDSQANAFDYTRKVQTTRGQVGENIRTDENGNETLGGKIGGFLYDAGMGMADSATNMALAMGNPFALAGLTATQAGASSAYDVASRGGSVNQMAATGLASALAEGISEAISLGNLKSLKTVAKSGGKGLLEAMGKQALVEGTEEGTSELLNKAADYLINKDLSASETQYRQYIADGMSEEEARKKVNDDIFADIMKSIGMGAISGGVFGAGANILGGATNTQSIPVLEQTEAQATPQTEVPNEIPTLNTTEEQFRAQKEVQEQMQEVAPVVSQETEPLLNSNEVPLAERVDGDALLDVQDLIEEIGGVAEISPNGYVTLYHRTTAESAKRIRESGKMSAKEDGIFFSTKKDGENSVGYGDEVVTLKVPIEKLMLDDMFTDEAHVKIPLESKNRTLDISEYLLPDSVSQSGMEILPTEQAQIGAETTDTANLPPIQENTLEKAQNEEDGVIRLVTGEPVSMDLQNAINRLANNEDVGYDSIRGIPELAHAELKAREKAKGGESISISTPERNAMRKQVADELLSRGSWQVDSSGKGAYNGVVERGKQVVFVIGLPASGKSSATANPISQHYKARIIDSDDAKTSSVFAEDYDNGYGAGYLHEESKAITESVLEQAIINGDNIVLPIIGSSFEKLSDRMDSFSKLGYETTLVLNELPGNKALGRALSRFVEEGRYIPLDILAGYGNKPTEVYERIMRGEGNVRPNNYARISNDVPRGSSPITIDSGGKCQEVYGGRRTRGVENKRNASQVSEKSGDAKQAEVKQIPVLEQKAQEPTEIPTLRETALEKPQKATESVPSGTEPTTEMRKRSYNDTIVERTDLPEVIKNEFISNPQMYEVLKNKTTQEQAQSLMDNLGTDEAYVQFNRLADAKNPVSVPMGRLLAQRLNAEGRTDMAVEVLRTMSTKLTEAGQFTQAAAIALMDSDPVMALQYVTRDLDSLNRKGREKFGDKWTDFELTEAEKEMFSKIEVGDTEAIKKAYEGIYNRIRKQYPSTMTEKLTEYRRVAMLLNTRTNVRNIVSNAMLLPVRWTSDRISALGQSVIHLVDSEYQRTQALAVGKESKKLAHDAWETVKEVMLGDEGKYEDSTQAVRDKQVFKGSKFASYIDNVTNGAITRANNAMGKDIDPSMMETARNLTYFLLKKGDDVFVQKNFEQRLASYIEAQGITSVEDIPADAITLAQQEAFKATFKDDTLLSRKLSGIKQGLGIFGEALLPFTKTPANLAMRGYDYSIGGYIDMFKTLANKKRTQADVSNAMDNLAKSLLGTAGIYAGYLLAKSGIITGALSDDDEEQAFQKKMGMLPFAIKVGENYYTYDWAQPASIPIILGASIYQSMEESDNLLNTWAQAGMAAVDAWFNLSPLQNIQDIFGGYGSTAENILGTLADMPGSLIPAQLGALARVGDTTQRQTYSNGDFWGSRIDSIKSKIPVLSETLPASYDTWGNEIKRSDSVGEAAFAQLLSPGQLGNSNVTAIDDEIMRLYDATGNNGVFPLKADWSYKINGVEVPLDNVSYSLMQQSMGESAYELAETFINSSGYSDLGDETKAKVLSDLYSFARALAKSKQLGYDIANSNDKVLYQIYQDGGAQSVVNYKIYKLQADANGNGNVSIEEAINYLDRLGGMSRSEKAYWFGTLNDSKNNPYR